MGTPGGEEHKHCCASLAVQPGVLSLVYESDTEPTRKRQPRTFPQGLGGEMHLGLVVATLLVASEAVPGDSSQSALLAGRFDATGDSTTCECTITAQKLGQPPIHRCVIPPTATPQLLWRHHRDSTRVRIRIIMSHVHVRPGVNAEPIDYPSGVFHGVFSLSLCFFDRKALLGLETRARRTGRETSDCKSRARLGRALD